MAKNITINYNATDKQRMFHKSTCDETLFGGAAGGGKLLEIHTPIPTPKGFVEIGKLKVGDSVFGLDGNAHEVIAAHEFKKHEAYELTFDDGAKVKCDAEHLWFTYTASDLSSMQRCTDKARAERRSKRPSRAQGGRGENVTRNTSRMNRERCYVYRSKEYGAVRSTAEIAETLKTRTGRTNHAVPVCKPLQIPERKLPLEPYLLGLWLGDGTSSSGQFTSADGLENAFADAGFNVTKLKAPYGYSVHGLCTILRKLGLLRNKHIPSEYLFSSYEQRLSLLQGLMDTDGFCSTNGHAEFTNTNKRLANDVRALVCSLGIKCGMNAYEAKLNGRVCGTKYRLRFTPTAPVFRLKRKLERQNTKFRKTLGYRYIVAARKIAPITMRCISIDSADHLYLATENFIATHNSYASVADAMAFCLQHRDVHVYMFRRTYPELEDSLIRTAVTMIPDGVGRYVAGRHDWEFPNGSAIHFRHCKSPTDVIKYQGAEIHRLYIDELTHWELGMFEFLKTRVRASTELGISPISKFTTNPGGTGHSWVKARFIDIAEPMTVSWLEVRSEALGGKVRRMSRIYIPAKATENPYLNEAYIYELEQKPKALREALLEGSWDSYDGQVFSEFMDNPDGYDSGIMTHVIRPFRIPDSWPRFRVMDWGYAKPFAVIWAAVSPEDVIYIYREWYGCEPDQPNTGVKLSASEVGRGIFRIESEYERGRHITGIADPHIYDTQTGDSVGDIMAREGVFFIKANNSRLLGWAQIHDRLRFDENGQCKLYFFETCKECIRTLPSLPYASTKGKAEDVDTESEDHCVVGGTLVLTPSGYKKIAELPDSGEVISHDGLAHKYRDCRKTQKSVDVYTLEAEDGTMVTATKNHRFMLADGTWKRLDELAAGDELFCCAPQEVSC